MGSDHNNKYKKNPKYSDLFNTKKSFKKRLSEGNLRGSDLLKNLKQEKEEINNVNLMKSKTDTKISEDSNKTEEEINSVKRARKETIDNLKSFSSHNLVKIGQGNDALKSDSENEESKSSINSNKINETPNKELYEDLDNDNSIEDDDENGEGIHDNVKEETEEEKQMISNNMKKVFIDSRPNKNNSSNIKNPNESSLTDESNNKNNRNPLLSTITVNDYELNFYRNEIDIRESYLHKLLSTKVWTPNMKPKKHNCIIIFDWDDTLLPTSFLTKGGTFYEDIQLSISEQKKISELENLVLELLNETIEKGNVYIITNAGKGWVEYSAQRYYPKIIPILEKIKIVSARGEYEKDFPGNSRQWKIEAFLMLQNTVDMQLVTNIICLGDSLFEMEAGRILASRFTEAFIKTIKFRETPKLDELIKQLKLVNKQFSSIYSSVKNLTIRVERKKK